MPNWWATAGEATMGQPAEGRPIVAIEGWPIVGRPICERVDRQLASVGLSSLGGV